MSELKFRVLLKETRKYVNNGVSIEELSLCKNWRDYFIIEQYIELEDSEGVEAYDGDIILMSDEAYILPDGKVVIEYFHGIPKVHPIDSRFYIGDAHELCRDRLGNHKPKHGIAGKIIGNIHEST